MTPSDPVTPVSAFDVTFSTSSLKRGVEPSSTPRVAAYPGTFDPPHNGHLDIYRQATWNFDKVIVVIAKNAGKEPFLDAVHRQEAWQRIIERPQDEVVIASPASAPITDVLHNLGAGSIVRGLRGPEDCAAERAFREFVQRVDPGSFEMVYYMCSSDLVDVSSTIIKQLLQLRRAGELIKNYVPHEVLGYIQERYLLPRA
jgi:pantetheine-phosphate adenylyltransferase